MANGDHDVHYDNVVEELRRLFAAADLRPNERVAAQSDLDDIRTMLDKLERGVIEISAFGQINSGKSSLLNALIDRPVFKISARGGETKMRSIEEWRPNVKSVEGRGKSKLVLVDTPGINEVEGAERAAIAEKTVRESDIVLFVVSGDLNDIEYKAIRTLHELHKPIVLALNKIDTFRKRELEEITASIKQRLAGIIPDENIVYVAARPGPRVKLLADGSEVNEQDLPPVIADAQKRILEILQSEGKAAAALNASLFAADMSERFAGLKVEIRQAEARNLVNKFMAVKALAVAINPLPLLDIAGGMSADAAMIYQLARIYDHPITMRNAQTVVKEISVAWGITATVEWVMHILSNVAKTATFGLSTVLTAIPQGLAAGWSTYVIGRAANVYFRDGGWGPKGPKATIEKILIDIDRDSVLAPLREQLLARLRSGRITQ